MARYPADGTNAGSRLFRRWFGQRFARATAQEGWASDEHIGAGRVTVGRQWTLGLTLVNTIAADADLPWESARAAIEQRLDTAGHNLALFVPRNAALPAVEPGLSELLLSAGEPVAVPDGRLELRRPVNLRLRRTSREGSVVTALGGIAPHWAQFTNRVAGSFQLNSTDLLRLPSDPTERTDLFDRIVLAAGQPDVDEGIALPAVDAWTAVDLEEGGSCVLGSPRPDDDEWRAALRRNLRRLLLRASEQRDREADATALAVLGVATYHDDERLSWALRGMDPALYAGYDVVVVIADGLVRPLLEPPPRSLPWDA